MQDKELDCVAAMLTVAVTCLIGFIDAVTPAAPTTDACIANSLTTDKAPVTETAAEPSVT
jgi:cephalosporin-C deacetylase-like acetyl esterase